jgi:hypothetical protein
MPGRRTSSRSWTAIAPSRRFSTSACRNSGGTKRSPIPRACSGSEPSTCAIQDDGGARVSFDRVPNASRPLASGATSTAHPSEPRFPLAAVVNGALFQCNIAAVQNNGSRRPETSRIATLAPQKCGRANTHSQNWTRPEPMSSSREGEQPISAISRATGVEGAGVLILAGRCGHRATISMVGIQSTR